MLGYNILQYIQNDYILALTSFVTGGIVSYLFYSPLLYLAKQFGWYDKPGERKLHSHKVPTIGGIGFFFGWLVSLLILFKFWEVKGFQFFLLGAVIIVSMGIKDDISILDFKKKFLGQILAAIIVVMLGDFRIESFYGILGINDLPYWASVVFTIFVFLLIINGYNLIDGIDGLAASIGILSSVVFGLWFLGTNMSNQYYLVAFALAGALVAFLKFNISPAKMFMGDTGSMLLGFVGAFLSVVLIMYHNETSSICNVPSNPVLAVSIVFLPLYETTRSFFTRLFSGKSPFKADNNHLHHLLLRQGLSHTQATIILVLFSITVIALEILFLHLKVGNLVSFGFLFIYAAIFNYLLYLKAKKKGDE